MPHGIATCLGDDSCMCAQAIEAQEPEAEIRGRTRTASSITYQTLFKYYPKLAGMTVRTRAPAPLLQEFVKLTCSLCHAFARAVCSPDSLSQWCRPAERSCQCIGHPYDCVVIILSSGHQNGSCCMSCAKCGVAPDLARRARPPARTRSCSRCTA